MANVSKAVLVYQVGLANVFAVDSFSAGGEGRNAKRLVQGSFAACEWFCRGLATAGAGVISMYCSEAGDVTEKEWHDDLEDAPFHTVMNPVFNQRVLIG